MITTTYDELFTFENICKAHFRGRKCKRDKRPLIRFEMEMLYHLYNLFKELADGKFKLSKYQYFTVAEPKVREIQTQPYVKRIVQHLLCDDILAPYFTANSIMDNCVCQKGKGEHFALNRFETMLRKHIDKRGTGGYFIKCDVLKYFPSIPHKRLKELFCNEIADEKLRNLVEYIIDSYTASKEFLDKYGIPSIEGETGTGRGIPIGNQTSQIFGMFYLDNLQGEGTRKNYRLHDFDTPHDKEMAVFTHAKKFSEYIFVITRKSPVRLRWSIISRLQNITVDIIENLYRANYSDDSKEREEYQKRAMTNLSIADHYTVTAKTMQAINFHQLTVISRQIYELKRLLAGWIRSDKKRTKE